jgi:hypothetical protein
MAYYVFIQNEKINGTGQCKQLTEGILNIEVEQEIYNDIEKYIYQDGEIILNPNYEAEQELKERERIAQLKLTKREVFLGLFQAKGVTPDMLKAQITDPQALIEFEYANDYYRGNPLIDIVGATLGITSEQLDKFFETNDYTCLLPIEVEDDNTENTAL